MLLSPLPGFTPRRCGVHTGFGGCFGVVMVHGCCALCRRNIVDGEPFVVSHNRLVCSDCSIGLIQPIYRLQGCGGIQHIAFTACLSSPFNKLQRSPISNYRHIFKRLLRRYKFQCPQCGNNTLEELTIDHIVPVSKGGSDDVENLQILCKSCNSRKGNRL